VSVRSSARRYLALLLWWRLGYSISSVIRCIVKGGSVRNDESVEVIRFIRSASELRSRDGVTAGGIGSSFSVGAKDSRRF